MGNELKLKFATREVTFSDLEFLSEVGILDALFDGDNTELDRKKIEISIDPKNRKRLLEICYDNDFSDVNMEGLPSSILNQGLDFFFIRWKTPLKKYAISKKILTPTTNRKTMTSTSGKK